MGAILKPQFAIDVPQPRFDRRLGEEELGRNLLVAQAARNTTQHLDFLSGRPRSLSPDRPTITVAVGALFGMRKLSYNPLRDRWAENRPATVRRPDSVYQILRRDVLQYVTNSPRRRRLPKD